MSIFEFAELIIYKHVEAEKEANRKLEKTSLELQSRLR